IAIGRKLPLHDGERVGGEIQQQEKENLHGSYYDRRISKQPLIGLMPQPQDESVTGQQQRPEQQQALLPRPQSGKLVGGRQVTIAVVKDVSNREVVGERRHYQNDGCQQY